MFEHCFLENRLAGEGLPLRLSGAGPALRRARLEGEGGAERDGDDPSDSRADAGRRLFLECLELIVPCRGMMLGVNVSERRVKEVDRGSPIVGRRLVELDPGSCKTPSPTEAYLAEGLLKLL